MSTVSLQELRLVAEALAGLKGLTVSGAVMRSDLRQLRLETAAGVLAVITVGTGPDGRPRLEVDVIRPEAAPSAQIEVRFESA